jgi:hypothetical protein
VLPYVFCANYYTCLVSPASVFVDVSCIHLCLYGRNSGLHAVKVENRSVDE